MSAKKRREKELTAQIAPVAWRLPAGLAGALIVGWSLLIAVLFTQRSAISLDYLTPMLDRLSAMRLFQPYMGQALAGLASAAWLTWLSCALGAWILIKMLPAASLQRGELISWGGSLGFGLLSFLTLTAGAFHAWYPATFAAILGALSAYLLWRRPLQAPAAPTPPLTAPWLPLWMILGLLMAGLFLLGCLAPEIFFDSLHYHLAIPSLYRMEHHVFGISTSLYSNFVMTIQMVWGLAITMGNTLTAKVMHGLISLLIVFAFMAFGRRYLTAGSGVLASLLFLGMPMIGNNLTTAGTDVAWSALQFVAAAALIRALVGDPSSSPAAAGRGPMDSPPTTAGNDVRWFWIAGALTGISASCKYPAFPYIPIALLLIVWRRKWDERQTWRVALTDSFHFLVPAMLFVAPVLIKNWAFHGNPLYPFGGTFLGHPKIDPKDWAQFISDTAPRTIRDEFESGERAWRFIAHPWYMTLGGDHTGQLIGPLFLIALPLLVLIRREEPAFVILRRYAILLWLLWLCTSTVPRYGAPALALAAPLLADLLLQAARPLWVRIPLLGAVALGTAQNLLFLLFLLFNMGGWTATGGLMPVDAYLGQQHATYPTPPYDAIAWMNQNLPARAKVLFTGESRSYYLERPAIMHSIPGRVPFVDWSAEAADGQALAAKLRSEGVTHLFLNLAEALRTDSYRSIHWDAKGWATLNDFWAHYVRQLWKEESNANQETKALYVYELLSDEEARMPHQAPPNPFTHWAPGAPQ